jgi:hypothetical protein
VQGMMLFVVAAGATQVMMTLLLLLVSHLVAAFRYSSTFVHLRLCTRTPMKDHRIENMTLSERVLVKKMTDPGTLNPNPKILTLLACLADAILFIFWYCDGEIENLKNLKME